MNLHFYIKKFKRNLSDYGPAQTLKKIILVLFQNIYLRRSYYIYRRNVYIDFCPEPPPSGIMFKIIGKDDGEIIRQIEDMEEWLDGRLPSFIEHGLCVVALDGDKVAGFNIVAFNEVFIPLLNMTRRLRKNQAWSEQITIRKNYRKQGLAISLRHLVFIELRERGICKFYGGALVSNIPSLKLAQRVGFTFVSKVQYSKILSKEFYTYRRVKHGDL